jgi:hypothetical protein
LGTLQAVEAEVEYTALFSVKVDVESGDVVSAGTRARDEDEPAAEVSVSLAGETNEPNELSDRGQQIVDTAAPFELRGWWAPATTQGRHPSPTTRPTPIATRRIRW